MESGNWGVCALCREEAELRLRHLMPSGIYKLLREPSLKNPNPITITPGVALATSKEVRKHFLCDACERRFDEGGERWMIRNCLQTSGEFASMRT